MHTVRRLPFVLTSLMAVVLLTPGIVLAQGSDELDVTMRMVADDDDLANSLIQELQLPDSPNGAVGNGDESRRGRADDLRQQGRSLGREVSAEARARREEQSLGRPGSDSAFSPDNPRSQIGDDRPAPDRDPGDRPGGRP